MSTAPENRRWVVRVQRGDGWGEAYPWRDESRARHFLELLGPGVRAVLVPCHATNERAELPKGTYRIQVIPSAHRKLDALSDSQREAIEAHLANVAALAARIAPPSRDVLMQAGITPPYLRFRAGGCVVIYDADREERALTVVEVAPLGQPHTG